MHNIRHVLTVLKKKNSGPPLRKELRVQKEEVQRLCCEVRALREAMSKERDKKSRKEGTERIQRALKQDREAWERGGGLETTEGSPCRGDHCLCLFPSVFVFINCVIDLSLNC